MHTLTRRSLLAAGLAGACSTIGLVHERPARAHAARARPAQGLPARLVDPRPDTRILLDAPPTKDPFTLGVASGDPSPDGVVLWTRLAPDPLADDGHGGMPRRNVEVHWQVATDERFAHVVASGTEIATPYNAHAVHAEPVGLEPGREYFYRFRTGRHLSPVGRTRTAPHPYVFGPDLRVAAASCAHYEQGLFTAYRAIAEDDPDLVLHLGDYIYEFGREHRPDLAVRHHDGPETSTLADYRRRHAQYKTDPDLQAAHAAAPWLVVFDDHEVADNWAGSHHRDDPPSAFLARRTAALRAYYENLPLRRGAEPRGTTMRLHRRITWGQLARFHLLDGRQYRDAQVCGGGWHSSSDCPERHDPSRQMLGHAQERWLAHGLTTSPTAWNLLGQPVPILVRDRRPGPGELVPVDAWDGYTAARRRLLDRLSTIPHKNPVVLSGDAHLHLAGELHVDAEDPESSRATVEFCVTSVSSGGDGVSETPVTRVIRDENPALSLVDARRGYLRARIAPHLLEVDHRVLPYVSRPGAVATTVASFAVEYGRPVLHRTRDDASPLP